MRDHEKIFVLVSPSIFPLCVVFVDHKYQQASPTTDSLLYSDIGYTPQLMKTFTETYTWTENKYYLIVLKILASGKLYEAIK